jgi:RAQPRD family integrative conjugative element protein
MKFLSAFLVMLFFCGGYSLKADASMQDEIEKRDLVLIQSQIDQMLVIVDRLQERQKRGFTGNSRIVLNTEALRREINLVRDGIGSYLQPLRFDARDLGIVKGDYLKRGR